MELFEAIAGQGLDEVRRQMVFGWLSTLLKLPYMDAGEKRNALILLDYLETLEAENTWYSGKSSTVPSLWRRRVRVYSTLFRMGFVSRKSTYSIPLRRRSSV